MMGIEDLRVSFLTPTGGNAPVLQGVDLDLPTGQFVTLIGSNGAGKSTLLNCITGDVAPTGGRIRIDDADVTGWPSRRRSGLVARVFQDPLAGTCATLTVEENLALAASRGRPRRLIQALNRPRRIWFRERLAGLGLGLEDRLREPMGLLSGGQRQAVSLIMATMQASRILLLDEHTAALDPGMQALVLKLTRNLVAERQLTTLMVTHSMRQALDIGDRTVMLHAGRVVLDVAGAERRRLGKNDLVARFSALRDDDIDDRLAVIDSDSRPAMPAATTTACAPSP